MEENLAVEVRDLVVAYQQKLVLLGVDLFLPRGKVIGMMGPNGAGKSTLLKTIMGLVPSKSGSTRLFSKSLKEVRKQVSYVPQKESLDWDFPASVLDVAVMGRYGRLGLFQRPIQADKDYAMACLRQVGMDALAHQQIGQLSGGQQQRVLLARSLAQEADLYLMDEPFVGVDAATESLIITLLKAEAGKGKTFIVVHHDLQSAPRYFDWSILLNQRVVASGPTEEVFTLALLQATYGNKLVFLNSANNMLQQASIM